MYHHYLEIKYKPFILADEVNETVMNYCPDFMDFLHVMCRRFRKWLNKTKKKHILLYLLRHRFVLVVFFILKMELV